MRPHPRFTLPQKNVMPIGGCAIYLRDMPLILTSTPHPQHDVTNIKLTPINMSSFMG